MSLRYEQYRSLVLTKKLLADLRQGNYKKEEVKDRARRCLRHFPYLAKNGEPIFSRDDFECPDLGGLQ